MSDRTTAERAAYDEERGYWVRVADGHFDEADLPLIRWHQQRVRENFSVPAGEMISEVGCGSGKLFRDHDRVLLIDFSPEILARAKRTYPHMLAVCASVDALPFRDGALRHIAANNMLHHVKGEGLLEPALDELHRVLADDGTIYINDRNPVFLHHIVMIVTMGCKKLLRRAFGEFGGCGSFNEPLFTRRDWSAIGERFQLERDEHYYTAAMWLVDALAKGLSVLTRRNDRILVASVQARAMPALLWLERRARWSAWCIERSTVATKRP